MRQGRLTHEYGVNPYAIVEVVEGIEAYMRQYQIENVTDLIGAVE